ncbi:hypothetical protein PGTUg99_003179 [Puccinia graminis f. sp. tritici]|uniref:Uncharacterized protein n=1 Tax=Puccinia graminis f. sp. tritici TaxID=56615 RepID=A0A5B0N911_PUCGR|nr:hypothetical protein PGTUg99_003179 [Puccinia graminis f. sp. tritici]
MVIARGVFSQGSNRRSPSPGMTHEATLTLHDYDDELLCALTSTTTSSPPSKYITTLLKGLAANIKQLGFEHFLASIPSTHPHYHQLHLLAAESFPIYCVNLYPVLPHSKSRAIAIDSPSRHLA